MPFGSRVLIEKLRDDSVDGVVES